jgi:hypothetical protein
MPLNLSEIYPQIKEMVEASKQVETYLISRREKAEQLFKEHASDLAFLKARVEAIPEKSTLRCALPMKESFNQGYAEPKNESQPVVLAADGSQITTSHHDPIEFGVVNIGVFRIQSGSGLVPETLTMTHLIYPHPVRLPWPRITEERVALERDLRERQILAELASQEELPVVTLTDGVLELFHEPQNEPGFRQKFSDYLDSLERLASLNSITAGYVDRPLANLVVRLLELAELTDEELGKTPQLHPLEGITDAFLFQSLLRPGERSAIFGLRSRSAKQFEEHNAQLALRFFYLNVGFPEKPSLARVEIPEWVAGQPETVDLLHGSLLEQCRKMGANPFPYALHRAHEIAVVRFEEKRQIESRIMAEFTGKGLPIGAYSNKQANKDAHLR